MKNITVKEFAHMAGVTLAILMEKLEQIDIHVDSPDYVLSAQDKVALLNSLKNPKEKKPEIVPLPVVEEKPVVEKKPVEEEVALTLAKAELVLPKMVHLPHQDMSVSDLSKLIHLSPKILIEKLQPLVDESLSVSSMIEAALSMVVLEELGIKVYLEDEKNASHDDWIKKIFDKENQSIEQTEKRPPIITMVGHVDHGKTSLLDYIRKTQITKKESGGITQKIGASYASYGDGGMTFIDTPGHQAFTAMRARGVHLTDIVVLVVAADDGVMPQTIESVKYVQEANSPIIVAINKIDKTQAKVEQIKSDLAKYQLIPREWQGDTPYVYLSAITGEGVNSLLNEILLQAEILELKTPSQSAACGVILESRLDKQCGPSSSLIVKRGVLKKGDHLFSKHSCGKIRMIKDEWGNAVNEIPTSRVAEVFGLSKLSVSGDAFYVIQDVKKTKIQFEEERDRPAPKGRNAQEDVLCVILKTDTYGSLDAVKNVLAELPDFKLKYIIAHIGNVNESDVNLAISTNAVVIGFNVVIENVAKKRIKEKNIPCICEKIIYRLSEKLQEMLGPDQTQEQINVLSEAKVIKIFRIRETILGCMVQKGKATINAKACIKRGDKILFHTKIVSLKILKKHMKEAKKGEECGIMIEKEMSENIALGDIIQTYE